MLLTVPLAVSPTVPLAVPPTVSLAVPTTKPLDARFFAPYVRGKAPRCNRDAQMVIKLLFLTSRRKGFMCEDVAWDCILFLVLLLNKGDILVPQNSGG